MATRSIWENISILISSATSALCKGAEAAERVASTAERLGATAEVMAEHNYENVKLESDSKFKIKQAELTSKYNKLLEDLQLEEHLEQDLKS